MRGKFFVFNLYIYIKDNTSPNVKVLHLNHNQRLFLEPQSQPTISATFYKFPTSETDWQLLLKHPVSL